MPHSDENQEKRICYECVGEEYLANEIERTGEEGECSYCEEVAQSWTIEDLSEQIEAAFERHYARTPNQPESWEVSLQVDRELDDLWIRGGTPVVDAIEEAAGIPSEAAEDVQVILAERHWDRHSEQIGEETEFSSETNYEEIGPSDETWRAEWRKFEQSLKSEARFFSRTAADHLASIFGDIHRLRTQDGRQLIVDAGPKTVLDHLYRARVFQSEEKLKDALCRPDLHLGSPPGRFAASGRMNARGISVFYGATEPSGALAEVRPPVGSHVVVAKFCIVRPLRMLDLSALEFVYEEGSIFDPSFKEKLERVAFLRSLGRLITKPVMPDDQDLDYLATQAIADFLATENEPRLDGIIFSSSQSESGNNVVLFHKAAKVAVEGFPAGTEITAQCCSEGEMGFSVHEEVPSQKASGPQDAYEVFQLDFPDFTEFDENYDSRSITLKIDISSVNVHYIDSVEVKSSSYAVTRHRMEKYSSQYMATMPLRWGPR
ncbi:RES domain-containing protein [Aeromonas salmonicida]|uniref:RES domain-containing protein n=1 Tax=Aeromonas salmonicida TaxID=645 RepID=UPI003BB74543